MKIPNKFHIRLLSLLFASAISAAGLTSCAQKVGTGNEDAIDFIELASRADARKDYETELILLQRALAEDPKNMSIIESIGKTTFRLKDYRASKEAYMALTTATDPTPRQFRGLALSRLALGDASGAIETLKSAAEKWPENLGLALLQAASLDIAGRHMDALALFETLNRDHPGDAFAKNNLALSLLVGGDTDKAISILKGLVAENPKDAGYAINLSLAYAMSGRSGDAVTATMGFLEPASIQQNIALGKDMTAMSEVQRARQLFLFPLLNDPLS